MNDKNLEDYLGIQHRRVTRRKFFGIDYSGSINAGEKIWITEAIYKENQIDIQDCYSIKSKLNISNRKDANGFLVQLIERNPDSVFGFDFPFSLPIGSDNSKSWRESILDFKKNWKDEVHFRENLRNTFKGKDRKRETDILARTPFSPYNLRIFKQTYFGISEILSPLLQLKNASILPFDEPEENKAWVMEVCPASFLKLRSKEIGWKAQYKGNKIHHRTNRDENLDFLVNCLSIKMSNEIKEAILSDVEGDGFDSLVCVVSAIRGLSYPEDAKANPLFLREGYVYY